MDNQNNSVDNTVVTEPTVVPTAEPTINPTVVPTAEPNVAPQAPSAQTNNKKGIIIAIVALLLIGAGVGVYFGFFRKVSGKQVIDGTINKMFASAVTASEKLEKNIVIDYKNDIVQTNGSIKATVETDDEEIKKSLNNLSSINLDYDVRLDLKTLSGSVDVTEKENDNEILTLNSLIQDKMLYFKTSKTSGVYKYDLTEAIDWDSIDVSKLPEYKSNSISSVVKKLQGYLKDAIKEEYIEQENGEFTVEGQSIKGLKTSIKLTEERTKEIEKSVYNSLLNDEEGLKLYAEFLMKDTAEVKSDIEKAKDALDKPSNTSTRANQDQAKKQELTINIYTTKQGKFLALDAISGENEKKNGITAISHDGTTDIKLYSNGAVALKLTYNEKDKELMWKNDAEGNKNETVIVKFEENGIKITFSMDGLKITLEFSEKINNDTVNMNLSASLDYDMDGTKLNGKVTYENNLRKVSEINTFDTSSSKDINTLSEAEQNEFTTQIKNTLERSVVFTMIEQTLQTKAKYQTDNVKDSIYKSAYCSQAYDCQNNGGEYLYCKYQYDGYEYSILCPVE